jgi:hypothetical protein
MIPQFDALNQDEKELMFEAIPLITLLIAYADGEMDDEERTWAEKITHIRSYANHETLQEFYERVGDHYQEKLDQMLESLPKDNEQRLTEISERLSGLNSILPKLDQVFAWRFYQDLISFAKHVAKASGGFLGWSSISKAEDELIGLDMINPIVLEAEPED